jgi:uncharacterized protein (TIGR02001 family)
MKLFKNLKFGLKLGAAAFLLMGGFVQAQDEGTQFEIPDLEGLEDEKSVITILGDVAVVSDYVFRGASRTKNEAAIQGTLGVEHEKGYYAQLFMSSLNDTRGHDVELEASVGFTQFVGLYSLDLSVAADTFHGGNDSTGYGEVRAKVSRDFGFLYLRGGMSYSPDNREIGGGDSLYSFGEIEFPVPLKKLPPMSINLRLGYEDFEGGFEKWDWAVGFFTEFNGFELGLVYHDTNKGSFAAGDRTFKLAFRKYF